MPFIISGIQTQNIANNNLVIKDDGTGSYKAIAHGKPDLRGFTKYRPEDLNIFGDDLLHELYRR